MSLHNQNYSEEFQEDFQGDPMLEESRAIEEEFQSAKSLKKEIQWNDRYEDQENDENFFASDRWPDSGERLNFGLGLMSEYDE